MRRSLVVVLTLSFLMLFSLWLAPRRSSTQTVGRQPIIRDESGKATQIYSRDHGRYFPVNDVRAQIAEISSKAPHDKKMERAFLESKKGLMTGNPHLSDDEKKNGLKRIDKIISRINHDEGLPPVPQPIDPLDPPDPPPPPPPPVESPTPPPNGIGFGILYVNPGYKNAWIGGSDVSYNIVAPPTAGGNNDGFLFLTSTNRTKDGVEALPVYVGQRNPDFDIYDWSIANAGGQGYVVILPYSAFVHNYYTIGICDAANPPCGGSVPFHNYQVLGLWNTTYQQSPGSNVWVNEVYLLNPSNNSWDFIYSHSYTSSLQNEQCSTCGWWGPIVELTQDNKTFSNMNVMGFANAWSCALNPGGSQDPNYSCVFNGVNTFEVGPTQGWQLLSSENVDLNNGFLVH